MNRILLTALILGSTSAWALPPTLGPSAELTLDSPWSEPVSLVFPEAGPYRLEATGLGGDPVEVLVEKQGVEGVWQPLVTNRTPRGSIQTGVEWSMETGETWRVRPPLAVPRTVVLRLKKSTFALLREVLKQGLTSGTEVPLPLKLRLELPIGTGGPGLTAAAGPRGELWIGWLTAHGTSAEVWDGRTGQRLGSPITAGRGLWLSLDLEGTDGPVLVAGLQGESEARAWSGLDWVVEAAPTVRSFSTAQGTFRFETSPARVWRATAGGWEDLELPRDRSLDRLLLGSTADGLYAILASSTGPGRAFYSWTPDGWSAFPPPPAEGPPEPGLWAASNGAGSLFHLEGRGPRLTLRQFDGTDWSSSLDLSDLASGKARYVALLPPSTWSKTGSLVLSADRVTVYDLP